MNVVNVIKTMVEVIRAFMADDNKLTTLSDEKLKFEISWRAMWGECTKDYRCELELRESRKQPMGNRWSVA